VTKSGFYVSNHELVCDGASLTAIAASVGTPVYVYSAAAIRARYRELDEAFGGYPHTLHYALKANSTLAIARLLRDLGSAADANSMWEIDVARRAGFTPSAIICTGVGKTIAELECALSLGVKAITVESVGELARIEAIARRLGVVARVSIRLNPDIDARSHPHISTGLKVNKFGVDLEEATGLFASIPQRPAVKLVAIHVHVGSQVTSLEPFQQAAELIARTAGDLKRQGHALEYLDLGGGLGISYDGREVPTSKEYAAALLARLRPTELPIVVEPGRALVAQAGALVAQVSDLKPRTAESDFAVIDAGMTELMRPALYNAFHRIEPVVPRDAPNQQYEIVGPVCESSDVVGRDRVLPKLEVGDLVAIRDAGAYGSVMSSNYNRRPMPPEVLVEDGEWRIIRRRQTVDDLLAMES
jgi:diaminopimelate decarboxylase